MDRGLYRAISVRDLSPHDSRQGARRPTDSRQSFRTKQGLSDPDIALPEGGWLCARASTMPQKKAHLRRSGDDARGAARINADKDLPNTKAAAWAEKFQGKATTADVLGDPMVDENVDFHVP